MIDFCVPNVYYGMNRNAHYSHLLHKNSNNKVDNATYFKNMKFALKVLTMICLIYLSIMYIIIKLSKE